MNYQNWEEAEKDSAYVLACQDLCICDFKAFVMLAYWYVFGERFIWVEGLHDVMARELMLVWTGSQQNTVENMPPRYGKTLMVCMFIAWAFGHNPKCIFAHLSFSDKLVTRNSRDIKRIMKHEFYRSMFATRISAKMDSAEDWETEEGGKFHARSTGGQITGFGAGQTTEIDADGNYTFCGMIWIDDPLKPSDAHTVEREKVNDHWDETIKSRRNSPRSTPTFCNMQRIHEGDFTAKLLSDKSENFKHVKLKALRDDGSALWPFKHTVEDLENMRSTNLFVFSSQYQQEPTAKGGSVFRDIWWQYYFHEPESFKRVIATGDTAQEKKTHNDFSVFQLWGLADNKIYLLDQVRGKWEADQLKSEAAETLRRWKLAYPKLNACYIEKAASGTGLIQSLPKLTSVPILPVTRGKGQNKSSRAMDAVPYIQSGMVFLPSGRSWVDMFVSECSSFNHDDTHLHDDQVDPMMDAIKILLDDQKSPAGFVMF